MLRTNWITGAVAALAIGLAAGAAAARPLSVEVWTDRGDDAVYRPGEAMQVKARTNDDSYLLVYTIDSEGQITMIYPFKRSPGMVEGSRTYRMPADNADYELTVEPETGQGYIVAIASRTPFRDLPWYLRPYDPQGESMGYEGRHDDEEGFDEEGRVVGDPTVAIERIRRQVLGATAMAADFATSYTTYYVGHEVRYPRYVCYDCHRPNRWSWWDGFDPYYTSCSVVDFRVNWNWCWGPCMWSGHVPYYYYVVRSDCPPRYRRWYDNHDRWSSWDGPRRWNDLWGGPLTRYKSPAPVGYTPPIKGQTPRTPPPGYLPTTFKNGGGRATVPIGRNRPEWASERTKQSGGTWRTPAGTPMGKPTRDPDAGDNGRSGERYGDRSGRGEQPRYEPPRRDDSGDRGDRGREQPRYEPPRREEPRQEQPRREAPPRYDPPRREDSPPPPPRQEQPRRDDTPRRQDPPQRQDPPKQDPPKQDNGGQRHKGGR